MADRSTSASLNVKSTKGFLARGLILPPISSGPLPSMPERATVARSPSSNDKPDTRPPKWLKLVAKAGCVDRSSRLMVPSLRTTAPMWTGKGAADADAATGGGAASDGHDGDDACLAPFFCGALLSGGTTDAKLSV